MDNSNYEPGDFSRRAERRSAGPALQWARLVDAVPRRSASFAFRTAGAPSGAAAVCHRRVKLILGLYATAAAEARDVQRALDECKLPSDPVAGTVRRRQDVQRTDDGQRADRSQSRSPSARSATHKAVVATPRRWRRRPRGAVWRRAGELTNRLAARPAARPGPGPGPAPSVCVALITEAAW